MLSTVEPPSTLLAVPYRSTVGPIEKNTIIIDWMIQHPFWLSAPCPPPVIRRECANVLALASIYNTIPQSRLEYYALELWDAGTFVGLVMFHRIIPYVDALFHFFLLPPVSLFRARDLLWNTLGHAFEKFNLQRISIEIPETMPKFVRIMRHKFGFKFEGEEQNAENSAISSLVGKSLGKLHLATHADAGRWSSSLGSRRERAHWDGKEYKDIVLLRLLRSEYNNSTPQKIVTAVDNNLNNTI